MPQIRDWSMNYLAITGTAVVGYMPQTQAGDLLLAVVNGKTAAPQAFWGNVANVSANLTPWPGGGGNCHIYTINSGGHYSGNVVTPGSLITGPTITAGTIITGQYTSDAAAQAVAWGNIVGSYGSTGTNKFVANSSQNIVINQLITGTGVNNSTYVSNVSTVGGNVVVTLTQNLYLPASGLYRYYPSGGTGIYSVNTSQTSGLATPSGNVDANISYAPLYSTVNGTLNSSVYYRISSGNEIDTPIRYGTTTTTQLHLIAVRDVNPNQPFNGNVIYNINTGGNIIPGLNGTGFVISNTSAFFAANLSVGSPLGTGSIMRVTTMTNGNIIAGAQLANTVIGTNLTYGNVIVAQMDGGITPAATASYGTQSGGSGVAGRYDMVLTSVTGTIFSGNLVGNVLGVAAGSYVTSYYSGNTTVFLTKPLTGTPTGTINFYIPGGLGNYIVNTSTVMISSPLPLPRTTGLSRGLMPSLFTANANSMMLYLNVDGTAVTNGTTAMVLEGPVTYEDGSDGAAQSQGFGWTIQRQAGVSPTNVYWNKQGSPNIANSLVTSICINPPAGGATAVPPYCASDSSYWIDPLNGVGQYNLNGAFTTNAVGAFGNSGLGSPGLLNNRLLFNGTVSSTVDVGINSYHALSTLTGSATGGRWSGASYAPVNIPNIAGKNILVHTRPSTPKSLQTTDPIGRAGVKGLAFGMASGAANLNLKTWHVHGSGTNWNASTFVPLIINNDAIAGNIANVGSLTTTAINNFGFFVSGSVVSPIWQFGSLWMLDTTVVGGGDLDEPIGVGDLLKICATGKERLSVLEQGLSQALILQPVQFGDGGRNPIYMNMDSTVIEFPQQYSLATKQVYYNAPDNICGITYYAGVGETVIHTNSVISSQSKYFWRFAPNSAGSDKATYSFASTFVQGAGNIVLQPNVSISGITFTRCIEIKPTGGNLTSCVFANTIASTGYGAVAILGSTQAGLQANLTALTGGQFNYNTGGTGALHLIYTGASTAGTPISLTSSTITFTGNNFDIYWDAPANTPLLFNQTVLSGVATTATAANTNTVSLPPIRTLTISGIVDGSNVSIYNANVFASPLVPIAGVANVGSTTLSSTVNNLAVASDTVNAGKYVATYTFTYTTALGSTSGSSTTLNVATLVSGNVLIGMTVNGTGVTAGTTITALGTGIGGAGTYTLSQAATISTGTYLTFDTPVTVVLLAPQYQALRPATSLVYAGTAITVYQQTDRQYSNPA
jgi:hypothetical protein